MSTWHLFSDSSGDGFRWEVAGRILQSVSDSTPTKALESTAPLPSMADLLLQGDSSFLPFFVESCLSCDSKEIELLFDASRMLEAYSTGRSDAWGNPNVQDWAREVCSS